MRMLNRRAGIAAGALAVAGLTLASTGVASADSPAARPSDAVGVGSDTLQNLADFLFDGAPGAVNGYNAQGNINRVYSVFSTGDANGRAIYDGTCGAAGANGLGTFCSATTSQAPNSLPGSVVLREGTKPVVRPNGSGAGAAALVQDTPGDATNFPGYEGLPNGSIQFARMSRLPNTTEEGTCPTSGACGGLHVYQAATDQLEIATSNISGATYEGPTGLSAKELVDIYSCTKTKWNQLPGNTTGSANTIHPLIPQSGSGTRNFFLADLQAANGGSAVTLGSCVRTVQEHDPTGIYADPTPADAIEPFSAGKIALINSGYFANGAGYKGTNGSNAYTANQLKLLSGTPGDTNPVYNSTRGLYFVIRQADLASKTPLQPGGTENWAQTLFTGSTSWIARSSQASAYAAAGFTQAYKDCGINPGTC
ncbi:MAG TPA: substrate-binding domain-containing protein [Mycobacteriales bacterium]|nr:substrate-binding domain-containing protein [Mycobacteriales bacterium]HWC34213.1 substrate-binding domain-containing protein [Mycobacteriales bacterium]